MTKKRRLIETQRALPGIGVEDTVLPPKGSYKNSFDPKGLVAQAAAMMDYMKELTENLSSARTRHGRDKIDFEHAKSKFVSVGARRTVQLSMEERFQNLKDPRTGNPNADWAKLAIEAELEVDPEFLKARSEFETARDRFYESEVRLVDLAERLGAYRTQATLLAALLSYMEGSGG